MHAPNGLIAHLFGPIEGRRHDAFMLGESGLNHILQRFRKSDGEPYNIYGDPAYGITRNILAPFSGARLTADQQEFNSQMSKVRCSVEWGFGKIIQNFAYLDFKKKLKGLVATSCKILCCWSSTDKLSYMLICVPFFNLDPPSLETYLRNR